MPTKVMWMVRAGSGSELIDEFRQKNIVAIGWVPVGNLENITDREQIIRLVQKQYPEYKEKQSKN